MFRFVTRFFAFIGLIFTLLIVLAIVGGVYAYRSQQAATAEPDQVILTLDLDEPVVEQKETTPFDLAMHDKVTSLFDLVRAIDRAKEDSRVKGIIARFGSSAPSMTQDQEIRGALARFRSSGKFTYAFGSSYGDFGMGSRAYYLASAFENIWLQPIGAVGLGGISAEVPFVKSGLEKIGISGDFMQREEYKSAMDTFTRDEFAPQVKIETQTMIDDIATQIAAGIAESRKWDVERVKKLMAAGPYTDEEAMQNGLVTHIGYADELDKEIDQKAGSDADRVNVEDYLQFARPTDSKSTHVALIYGTGLIQDKSEGPAEIPGEHVLGADKIAEAFDNAADQSDIKAILFRIDSPGGTPEASETIRHALIHAQKKGKPVIVSMGAVAASGGYWSAMNADRIVAEPATLTGSIGVFAGKFVVGGAMQKLGVNWNQLQTDENAGIWSMNNGFSTSQRARVDALLDRTYKAFVSNVAEARKIAPEKMGDVAKGRVWTGDQAIKLGLVDDLGGYDVAVDNIRKSLKLDAQAPIVLEVFPAPESPVERVLKWLKETSGQSAMMGPMMLQWQKMAMLLQPFFHAMTGNGGVQMRMSDDALRLTR